MLRYGLTGGLSVQHIQLHQGDISQTYWFCYLGGKEGTQGLTVQHIGSLIHVRSPNAEPEFWFRSRRLKWHSVLNF
ncbi:hypothetical protein VNO77_04711 [Canavalia gladiata]|uniref:Uncharacterized protein n=1 Tax=Canavalia gladiata TaxID=3824 RepID=A0AAN9MX07_CANGL